MIIGIPREITDGERRVAVVPDTIKRMGRDGVTARVEHGAGSEASFSDDAYAAVGAEIVNDTEKLWHDADVVLKIHIPRVHPTLGRHEADLARQGSVIVGLFQPHANLDVIHKLAERGVTAFSLDALPRITRAQTMDVLSSMSTVAGYKAVLMAAEHLGRFFPMLVTAAGTLAPSRVLVLGAGVAGLQAIATARRLGAVVQAFDVRPVVKEQVESLGAQFLEAEAVTDEAEGEGGYAKELSEEQHKRELELIHKHIKDADAVITTALIPGKPAPLLITEEMVADMKPGSVILDLAAEAGGNSAQTKGGSAVQIGGVTILGPLNLPSTMPIHASQMYSRNIATFLQNMLKDGALELDFEDEITASTCITHDGNVVHEATRMAIEGGRGS